MHSLFGLGSHEITASRRRREKVTPKLPGAGPASALLLAVVLGVWLGIFGPISLEGLHRWQTLLASFVAVVAAFIAYAAAMAKVKLDRKISDEQTMRRALAIFLKLEFAIQVLRQEGRDLQKKVDSWNVGPFKTTALAITEPKEILEAWETLDIFPPKLTTALRLIRAALITYKTDLARFDPETAFPTIPNTPGLRDTNPTVVTADFVRMLIEQTTSTSALLRTEIDRLTDRLQRST
jgi:hypothetical protein